MAGVSETGRLILYMTKQSIVSDDFKKSRGYDLQLRYEHVADRLHHIFQEYYDYEQKKDFLYACGYMDNTIRVFEFKEGHYDRHLVHTVQDHSAPVTCLAFSENFKYLYTCDEDGLINHYQRYINDCDFIDKEERNDINNVSKALECNDKSKVPLTNTGRIPSGNRRRGAAFPFVLINTIHDQLQEIIAIDTNETLDMYVTLSQDGTIALRCQRTSRVMQHFMVQAKPDGKEKRIRGKGNQLVHEMLCKFNEIFKKVHFLKLSLHGYIIICGEGVPTYSIEERNKFLYLVFSLNGDLIRQHAEKSEKHIKSMFLNNKEDMLIVASNHIREGKEQNGHLDVLKLYGLEPINKSYGIHNLVYDDTINKLQKIKVGGKVKKMIPSI